MLRRSTRSRAALRRAVTSLSFCPGCMLRYRLGRVGYGVQHEDVCWRGRAEAACAALYPHRDSTAGDAHEQRVPGTHGDEACAPCVRTAAVFRPCIEGYPQNPSVSV
jgi:hypothetical protein